MVGWPNIITINTENKTWGWHWKRIFDEIMRKNQISDEDMEYFAKYFALKNTENEIKLQKSPMNLDFCDNIEIKYDDYNYSYLNNVLDNSIHLANEIKTLKIQIKDLKKQLKELNK